MEIHKKKDWNKKIVSMSCVILAFCSYKVELTERNMSKTEALFDHLYHFKHVCWKSQHLCICTVVGLEARRHSRFLDGPISATCRSEVEFLGWSFILFRKACCCVGSRHAMELQTSTVFSFFLFGFFSSEVFGVQLIDLLFGTNVLVSGAQWSKWANHDTCLTWFSLPLMLTSSHRNLQRSNGSWG